MATTQYIGARYVPLFADPAEWDSTKQYEPLTIVLHEGNSYTSRQYVPAGIEITNEKFWALTGNYNAQVEAYRKEVLSISPLDETPTKGSTKGVTSDGIEKAISDETTRATQAEQTNATAISDEVNRAKIAEQTNATAISEEVNRATNIENALSIKLNNYIPIENTAAFANNTYPVGTFIITKGFYTAGDNGSACYLISSDGTNNGVDSFKTANNYYANLVNTNTVQLEQLGVKSDADFSTIYNYAITKYRIIGTGTYTLNNSITPISNSFTDINEITYTGNGSAILIKDISYAEFKVHRVKTNKSSATITKNLIALDIQSDNAIVNLNKITVNFIFGFYIGINLNCVDNSSVGIQYNEIHFQWAACAYACIYGNITVGWIDQNIFFCGKCETNLFALSTPNYGVYLASADSADFINGNRFYSLALEGCYEGVYLSNAQQNSFIGFRAFEGISSKIAFELTEAYANYFEGTASFDIVGTVGYMVKCNNSKQSASPNTFIARWFNDSYPLMTNNVYIGKYITIDGQNNQYYKNFTISEDNMIINTPYTNCGIRLYFPDSSRITKVIIPRDYFVGNNIRVQFAYISSSWGNIQIVDDKGNVIDTLSGVEGNDVIKEYALFGLNSYTSTVIYNPSK